MQEAFLKCLNEVKTIPIVYNAFCLVVSMIQPSFAATKEQFENRHTLFSIVPLSPVASSALLNL